MVVAYVQEVLSADTEHSPVLQEVQDVVDNFAEDTEDVHNAAGPLVQVDEEDTPGEVVHQVQEVHTSALWRDGTEVVRSRLVAGLGPVVRHYSEVPVREAQRLVENSPDQDWATADVEVRSAGSVAGEVATVAADSATGAALATAEVAAVPEVVVEMTVGRMEVQVGRVQADEASGEVLDVDHEVADGVPDEEVLDVQVRGEALDEMVDGTADAMADARVGERDILMVLALEVRSYLLGRWLGEAHYSVDTSELMRMGYS